MMVAGALHELWLLPFGVVVAAVGTLVGAGGAALVVPVFLIVFPEMRVDTLTQTSLILVAANALSGTFSYARMGRIHYPSAVRFAAATIPGAILGVWAVRRTPVASFSILFALLLLLVAAAIVWHTFRRRWEAAGDVPRPDWRGVTASAGVGFVSSFFGIGGGILHVTLLATWLGYPVHTATAVSHFVLAVTALTGVATHLVMTGLPARPEMALYLVLGAIPGAMIGARLSSRVSSRAILLVLAGGIALLSVRLLWQAV